MAEAVATAIGERPPPRRAGRHRHRQEPRLPRARPSCPAAEWSWPPPPRRCRTSWPARTSRSWPSTSTCPFDCGRPEGPVQLRLPASGCTRAGAGAGQLRRCEDLRRRSGDEVERLATWAATTTDGRPGRADCGPSARAWQAVSVASEECPGAARCPLGEPCFAEEARRRAAAADVVVVNTHLYGLARRPAGRRRPARARRRRASTRPTSSRTSCRTRPGFGHRRRAASPTWPGCARRDPGRRPSSLGAVGRRRRRPRRRARTVRRASACRRPCRGHSPTPSSRRRGSRSTACSAALRAITTDVADADQREAAGPEGGRPPWPTTSTPRSPTPARPRRVGRRAGRRPPRLEVAPIDVAPVLATASGTAHGHPHQRHHPAPPARAGRAARRLRPTCSTSAARSTTRTHALLYCAAHLPDPRQPAFEPAVHDELEALIAAAGGRTLALFTSWRAMNAAAEALRARGCRYRPHPERPAQAGAARRASRRRDRRACSPPWACSRASTCPGRRSASSPSTASRSPAPTTRCSRPGASGPGADAFRGIDLPAGRHAAGPGRRAADPHARPTAASSPCSTPAWPRAGYRWDIVRALPPMRRTRHRAEAEAFLRAHADLIAAASSRCCRRGACRAVEPSGECEPGRQRSWHDGATWSR